MATLSFVKRLLEVHITLRKGQFASGTDTKIVTGIPLKVRIEKTGPPDFNKANIEIRGMRYEDMEQLSTLAFKPLFNAHNLVQVYAGDEENGLSLAFSGEITQASADFNGAPDITFKIDAMTGYFGNTTPSGPTAIKGNQAASTFIEQQAKKCGYSFRNDGVTENLQNAVLNGSPIAQARAAARQINAELIIDDNVVILSPRGGKKDTEKNAVLLNKDSGMIGYPTITNEGLQLKSLYNPAYQLGSLVKVESIVPHASGIWRIIKLTHDLAAFDPSGGPWFSEMTTFYPSMSGAGGKI